MTIHTFTVTLTTDHDEAGLGEALRRALTHAVAEIGATQTVERQPQCDRTLGELRCELPAGHGRFHKHTKPSTCITGWED